MQHGQYIDGRYKIIKNIGSGGMANVYLAKDLILEREVAIKIMRYDFSSDEENVRRFKREAAATTSLSHQNIVPVYDVGEDEDYYIVMEYVDGYNLKEYIELHDPIPYQKVIDIMSQILSGVDYAHSKGIIHRDLKPHNILINKKGRVLITDFGIAVALSENSITQTNSLLGSVQYISPEQARGSIASRQSDIYSLGIMLYEMLSGQVPFYGESAVSIALQHFQQDLPSLKEIDPDLPQALENVVIKATAKDPKHRYSRAEDMRQDLLTALRPERANEAPYVIPRDEDQFAETIRMDAIQDPVETQVLSKEDMQDTGSVDEQKNDQEYPEVSPQYVESKPKNRRGRKRWLLFLGLFLLVFAFIIYYVTSQPGTVKVPDVKGMTEEQAISKLSDYNLLVGDVIEEPSEDYAVGEVTRTNPQVNTSVKEKSKVDLFISTGQELYPVPDVVGQDFERIRAELTEIGFEVERVNEASHDYAEGVIAKQSIAAGKEVLPSETTITLTVSTGKPSFSLRDLTGYSWQSVLDYAEERELVANRTEEYSNQVSEGLVISQDPAPGTELKAGDHLNVVISLGPEQVPESQESESSSGPVSLVPVQANVDYVDNGTGTNKIDIYVEDANHSMDQLYTSRVINQSSSLSFNLELSEGEIGRYRIYRDGQLIHDMNVAN